MSRTHLQEVIRYYKETDWDHRHVWNRGLYQSAHFGIYDHKAKDHQSALLNTNEVMSELVHLKPGMKVMDAGCGWGGVSLWLVQEKQVLVYGVNITPYQVKECKDKAKEAGLQYQCIFIESDYCHTPFADDQFDVVWSCESLCHALHKEQFYREAHRILKPGGKIVIADYHRTKRSIPKIQEKMMRTWMDGWAIADLNTSQEHVEMAETVGFTDWMISDYSTAVEPSLRNLYRHAARWSWLGTLGSSLGLLKSTRNKNVKGTIAMYEAFKLGLWKYILVRAVKPYLGSQQPHL